MFRSFAFSATTFILSALISFHAEAFEVTKNSANDHAWDNSLENAFIFSAAPDSTADLQLTDNTYLKMGFGSEGNSFRDWQPGLSNDGTVGVTETGFRNFGRNQYGVGRWEYTDKKSDIVLPFGRRQNGMYVLAERSLYSEDDKTVVAFARAGRAAGDLAQSSNGWSTGIVMKGFVKDRPEGQLGFAVSGGTDRANGRNLGNLDNTRNGMETRAEITYLDKITDDITIQPGVRFSLNPDNRDLTGESGDLTAGIRIHVRLK
jgi:carbohydrate-selective porin OprB